jgi:hypothetical protein
MAVFTADGDRTVLKLQIVREVLVYASIDRQGIVRYSG